MSSPALELNNEIVRAGAGAGKTTQLTKRVLDVARLWHEKSGRLPRIVVTTFTKKATEELRERLLKNAIEDSSEVMLEFVTQPAHLQISTIHGVLVTFLRRYGPLLDIDAGFSVLDGAGALKRKRRLLRQALVAEPEFQDLLEHYNTSKMILLLDSWLEVSVEVQPVTLDELNASYDKHVAMTLKNLIGVCDEILAECSAVNWRSAIEDLRQRMVSVLELASAASSSVVNRLSGDEILAKIEDFKMPKFMKKAQAYSEHLNLELKEAMLGLKELAAPRFQPDNFQAFEQCAEIFARLAADFTTRLDHEIEQTGVFEMRDLERYSLKAVVNFPELAQAFAADVDYWLIDEFQDTSPLQIRILRALMGSRPGFFVGDPQQSIYLFRGARSEVFTEKESEIVASGGAKSTLEVNYRSRPPLVEFFNVFFSTFAQPFMQMKAADKPEEPSANPAVKIFVTSKDDEAPHFEVAREIERRVASGERFDDFCVLARTNTDLIEVARYFESVSLPVHVHSGGRYYERREVLDLVSILKFLVNPFDNKNLVRLLRSPWLRVSDTELVSVLSQAPVFYFKALKEKWPLQPVLLKLDSYQQKARQIGIYETLREAAIELRMIDLAQFHDVTGRREANIWKFFTLLKEKEKTPGFSYLQFVQDVLDPKSDEGDAEADAVAALEPNCVNFMTVHKSKGLKFQNVILINMQKPPKYSRSRGHDRPLVIDEQKGLMSVGLRLGEELKFEHSILARLVLNSDSEREMAEYERLLYVAMTRSARSLILQWQGSEPTKGSWASYLSGFLASDRTLKPNIVELSEVPTLGSHEARNDSASRSERGPLVTAADLTKKPEARARYVIQASAVSMSTVSVTKLLAEKDPAAAIQPPAATDRGSEFSEVKTSQLMIPVVGQKIHTLFERLKYSKSFNREEYMKRWFRSSEVEILSGIEFTLGLTAPPVQKLIESGEVEWGFQLKANGRIVEGQIDLWGRADGVTWIVDYKSGTSRFRDKAFAQLDLYSLALRQFGETNAIKCAVIYVVEKKVEVRDASDAQATRRQFNL